MTSAPSTAQSNEALVRRGYDAFAAVDLPAFGELFSADIVWHVPGRNPLSGSKKGLEATLRYFGELAGRTDGTFRATLQEVIASDTTAVGIHVDTAQRGTHTLDMRIVLVFRISEGRAVEVWEHYHDQCAVDDFLS